MACVPAFDEKAFLLVQGECLVTAEDGGSLIGFDAGEKIGQFMLDGDGSFQGEVFRYTLKVRDDAPVGRYTLGGNMPVRNTQGHLDVTVEEAAVTVVSAKDGTIPTTMTEAPKPQTTDVPHDAKEQPGSPEQPDSPEQPGNPEQPQNTVGSESVEIPAEKLGDSQRDLPMGMIVLWCVLVAAAAACLVIRSVLRKKNR